MTKAERNQLAQLTGQESNRSVRYYSSKTSARRRAGALRLLNPSFLFYVDKFDVTPAATQPLYKFAVCVEHPRHYAFNNPSHPPMRCV